MRTLVHLILVLIAADFLMACNPSKLFTQDNSKCCGNIQKESLCVFMTLSMLIAARLVSVPIK